MVLRVALTSAVLSLGSPCGAQWASIIVPDTAVFDVHALSADTVIVASDYGKIMRSTDGGLNWTIFQTTYVWEWFVDIDFPTPMVGYISGGADFGSQCMAKTIDGGLTWSPLDNAGWGSGTIGEIEFLNSETGVVLAGSARRTVDGGASFEAIELGPTYVYCTTAAYKGATTSFLAVRHWMGGDNGEYNILRSEDLFATWDTVYSEYSTDFQSSNRAITEMQFIDDLHGFAVGHNGGFMKTMDGGETWTYSNIPDGGYLADVHFISPTVGWVAGERILHTEDGGATWVEQEHGTSEGVQRLHMVDEDLGYATAWENIFKTENGGMTNSIPESPSGTALFLHPNPVSDKLTISLADQGSIIAVSAVDVMGRTTHLKLTDCSSVDVSDLADGVYNIIVRTGESIVHGKVVVAR